MTPNQAKTILEDILSIGIKAVMIQDKAIQTITQTSSNHFRAFLAFKKQYPNAVLVHSETFRGQWNDAIKTLQKKRLKQVGYNNATLDAIDIIAKIDEPALKDMA